MNSYAKVSISLPHCTLERVDRERQASGESRSEFFRRAVDAQLHQEKQRKAIDRYVAGYAAEPETAYDEESWGRTGTEALGGDPWD